MLGMPIGHPDFVRAWTAERLHEELKLLQQLPLLMDLQCSWLLLFMCASPRANARYGRCPRLSHKGMPTRMARPFGTPSARASVASLRRLRSMRGPSHLGLGLHSAQRTAPAAYWAAWADALPAFAEQCVQALESCSHNLPSLLEAAEARALCKQKGGMTAPPGAPCCGGHVRPLLKTQGLEIGHMAGRCTRRGYASFTIATACYCQPCHPAPRHSCVPRASGRRMACGHPD